VAAWRQDLTHTIRRLSKSPGFVFAVVVSIGLGIAANATIFSMVSRFVLRPAPVGDPSTLMSLHTTYNYQCCNHFPWPVYTDVRDQAQSFSGVAAYYELVPASMGGSGEPERVWGQSTTSNYFDVAELPMTLGRGFISNEERSPVIVLGYRLWQRRFGADPAILGRPIMLSGRPFTVVGVAPPAFHGLDTPLDPEFWVPLGNLDQLVPNAPKSDVRAIHWLAVLGRLKPGVTRIQAAAELNLLAHRFAVSYPETDQGGGFRFEPAGSLPPRDRSAVILFLVALSIVVLLVLSIAGANAANLLLARAAARQREMAVRIALGATRGRLLRQMLIESLLLALGGGLFGVVLSEWATRALSAFHLPAPVPLDLRISVDWRVLLYAFALSVGTGLLFGMLPAWAGSRPMVSSALKGEDALTRPGRRWSLRNILVVSQIAVSLVLLSATGLFLRSMQSAAGINIGFRSNGILMMAVDPQVHGYTPERAVQLLEQWRRHVAALPGVIAVACTDTPPLSGGNRSDIFRAQGRPQSNQPDAGVELYMATPGYFKTLGIPRLAGRDFADESSSGPKVAVVSQAFVERVLGGENPIGQQVTGGGVTYQIIGVVGDIKSRTLGEELRPVLYRSLAQSIAGDPSVMGYSLLVRTSGNPAALVGAVRGEVRSLDPAMAIFNVETMEQHLRNALFLPRLAATLFGVFGFAGLALAGVGLYGVMSYSVSRRTREIGIRLALGAPIGRVQRLIVRQGMGLAVIAVALGLPASWAVARFSASFLYGVRPHDPMTFVAVPLFLTTIAFLACWVPARRATSVDPQAALRRE
jgi:predicted permease